MSMSQENLQRPNMHQGMVLMSAETFQTILGSFVETVKIIAIIVVLMVVIKFSELKYKNKIREKNYCRTV